MKTTNRNKMGNNKSKATLDKKSISAIVDQVEARMRRPDTETSDYKESRENRESSDRRGGSKKVFFWGAASGLAFAVAAPLFGKQARPVLRGAVKGGIAAGRYVQRVASSVKEDMQDITAEAKADLDAENFGKEPLS